MNFRLKNMKGKLLEAWEPVQEVRLEINRQRNGSTDKAQNYNMKTDNRFFRNVEVFRRVVAHTQKCMCACTHTIKKPGHKQQR
jgi:hypothetical protein